MAQTATPSAFSQTWTFFEGAWHEGNVPIMGARTHAAWLGSTVFDGARAFEGVAPDLDRHCARVNQSAVNFKLKPVVDTETWLGLAREGIARFGANAELYIRPMYWAQNGSGGGVLFDPETTNWCLCIYVAPMPAAERRGHHPVAVPPADDGERPGGLQGGLSLSEQFARADRSAGAGFRQLPAARHARQCRGVRQFERVHGADGVVYTPAPNGTFLNGITRQRVIDLLRGDGVTVVEADLDLSRFPACRRNFLKRQFRQGGARDPDRRSVAAAGTVLPAGTQAVLGLCPRLTRYQGP